ncbi:MAG: hypothetical protein KDJ88_08410 [Bauldia sp.]|nr:hypothetical protein [Bauldia sp.]
MLRTSARSPDLSPRPDAELEWWFVQGSFSVDQGECLHFMAALFQVRGIDHAATPGHMLLVHVMDSQGGHRRTSSRITGPIVSAHAALAGRIADTNFGQLLSRLILQRHMQDVMSPLREREISEVSPPDRFGGSPLVVDWLDFSLAQEEDGVRLILPIDHRGGSAELFIEPVSPWLCETGDTLDPELAPPYSYLSCPRMSVRGTLGGRSISGRAWIDRQWGAFDGWFFTEAGGRASLLGWDWLGLSLDNGQDLLYMRHQPIAEAAPRRGYAVLFDEGAARLLFGQVVQEPVRSWTSPRTGIVYPVGQRIIFPDIDAEFDVKPLIEDQEILVFGVPAIWEGAVAAEGRMAGRQIRGSGRLELFGYGFADTLPRYVIRAIRKRLSYFGNGPISPSGHPPAP